jgi:hypothetical protein
MFNLIIDILSTFKKGSSVTMKFKIAISLLSTFLLAGCTSTNAFTKFNIDEQQQQTFSNFRVSKIFDKNVSIGTVSAIYLNNIMPDKYKDGEYFYVTLYLQNKEKLTYLLNGNPPQSIEQLPRDNQYGKLLSASDNWHQYYLVVFKKVANEHLALVAKQANYHSYALKYLKNQ